MYRHIFKQRIVNNSGNAARRDYFPAAVYACILAVLQYRSQGVLVEVRAAGFFHALPVENGAYFRYRLPFIVQRENLLHDRRGLFVNLEAPVRSDLIAEGKAAARYFTL